VKEALIKDNLPMDLPTNDLRKTKGAFVRRFMEKMSDEAEGRVLTKNEKYTAALKGWMDSSLRAVLHMSKTPGFAIVTTRD